jgi:catechol 2,3-dioxygenase-like lactoylglutathione lyase family enzyme
LWVLSDFCVHFGFASGQQIPEAMLCTCPMFFSRQNGQMRLEHAALQVTDPVAMADWYVKHLGVTIARSGAPPGNARFLKAGPVLIEIYRNPDLPVPDYPAMHPLLLHLAFESDNVKADRDRLLAAGAKLAEDISTNKLGDELLMLRDPWGLGLQLVKRGTPMLF